MFCLNTTNKLNNWEFDKNAASGNVVVLSELYLPVKGGHVVWLHEVCQRIPRISIITGACGRPLGNENINGVSVRRVDFSRKWYLRPESLGMYFRMYRVGLRETRHMRPKVVLAARAQPEGVVAVKIRKRTNIPIIAFAHGEEIARALPGVPLPRRHRYRAAMKRRILWDTYKSLDAIIANSNFTRNLLIKGGVDAQRIRVIHPGTDPHQFCPGPKPNELIHQMNLSERKVALSVGRLTVRKGQDMTIEAWPKVLEKVPNAVYLIVGTGEYEHHLRELAKKMGVERSICFIGEVTAEELPRIYRMADLFIMPSRQLPGSRDVEGFGIVYLEAGASGLPCIGGRCGGIPDAIEDGRTGILVDGDSPNEIALAVVDLFNNPKRASSMGDMARHRVLESFTWERSATNIRRLIDSIERDK